MMSRIALVRTSAVLLGGPWAAAWLPQWSLGGSVAAAGGVQRYYAHVALPEDLVSIRAAETTYRYMRTPSQAVTRGSLASQLQNLDVRALAELRNRASRAACCSR